MAKTRTKDQPATSINIKSARYFLDTIYASNVENVKMNKIARNIDLIRFIDGLETLIESSSTLTLTATVSGSKSNH